MDKFLTDIQLKFRERYKTVLLNRFFAGQNFGDFSEFFLNILKEREEETKQEQKSGK